MVLSDEEGSYELSDLPPGSYTVEVRYAGVTPIRRQVVVQQGTTTPLDISSAPELAQASTTVVVEERHLTRPDSTASGTVLTLEEQNRIGVNRQFSSLAQEVAGVSGGANPDVRGGNALMNRYLIDGLDVSDPLNNTASATISFDAISSVQVLTGGMEAQYNSLGGTFNLISATGSDEFHLDSSFYGTHYALSAPANYGNQISSGVRTFTENQRPPTQSAQANLTVSGPIAKHSLWFSASFEYSNTQASVPAAPPLNIQNPNQVTIGYYSRAKLTWAPSSRHRLTLAALGDPATVDYLNFNSAVANRTSLFAASRQNQGGIVGSLNWEYFPTPKISTKLEIAGVAQKLDTGPQGKLGGIDASDIEGKGYRVTTYDPDRPRHINNDDNTAWYNTSNAVDRRRKVQLDGFISWREHFHGYHEAQFGFETTVLTRNRWTDYPGDRTYTDQGGGPGEAGLCNETTGVGCFEYTQINPYQTRQNAWGVGLYVQDRWKPLRWLYILPGLRFDYGRNKNTAGDTITRLYGFGPRLGAALDLTGDQKTVLSLFYGRANETLSLIPASSSDTLTEAAGNIYRWSRSARQFVFNRSTGGEGTFTTDLATNHTPPHTDEILISLRREIFRNSVASIEYTYKRISNILDRIEVNRIWDPSGTRVIDYANGDPRPVWRYTTPDGNYVKYHSLDLIFEGRPSPNWSLYGAYTLAFKSGPGIEELGFLGGPSQGFSPRANMFFDGYALGDVRHQLKGHGYFIWHNFSFGPNFRFQTGTVLQEFFQANTGFNIGNSTNLTFRSPTGTRPENPNDPDQVVEYRTPDLLIINARAAYDFHDLIGQHLIFSVDAFNILNLSTPIAFNSINNASFGTVANRLQPFRLQLGLHFFY